VRPARRLLPCRLAPRYRPTHHGQRIGSSARALVKGRTTIGPPRGSVQYFGLFVVVAGALLLIGLAIAEGGQWPLVAALFVVVAATLLVIERARTR